MTDETNDGTSSAAGTDTTTDRAGSVPQVDAAGEPVVRDNGTTGTVI